MAVKRHNKDLDNIILRPRITEKSSLLMEGSAYTFEIIKSATKDDVKRAIKQIYGVEPVRVNITTKPSKQIGMRHRKGMKSGLKKAVVYLKKGDSITVV